MKSTRKWSSQLTITKIDQEQRLVEGFASSERIDSQDDIVDSQAMKDALPEYMQYANLREMHHGPEGQLETTAAGTVIKAEVIDGEIEVGGITYKNPLHIICKVVDDAAWEKVKEGVYKGFSIGGKIVKAVRETIDGKSIRRIVKLLLYEISLVDRPANQDARILLWKAHTMSELEKAAGALDLSKPIAAIQAARNDAELAGDGDTAQLYTQAIQLILQASGEEPAPEEAPAEDEAVAAEDQVEAAAKDDEGAVVASAQPSFQKAGRTLNRTNMESMKATIKSLLTMLATAGDETAAKALQLYTPAPQPGVEQKSASAEDLSKAMAITLEPIFKAITDKLSEVGSEIETLKRQPRAGGPAARVVVDKQLPGTAQAEPVKLSKAQAEQGIANYRKLAATEPDPMRRRHYESKVAELEKALA